MLHYYHPDQGTWAFCENPVAIDGDADDEGRPIGVYCPYRDNGGDGILVVGPYSTVEYPEEPTCDSESPEDGLCWLYPGHEGSHEGAGGGSWR